MSNVGGPRQSPDNRGGLPGAGSMCGFCGFLKIADGVCPRCGDDPGWLASNTQARRPAPQAKPSGRAVAAAALHVPPPPEPETQTHRFTVLSSVSDTEAHAQVDNPDYGTFTGHGATLAEALLDAVAQMEEHANRPHCPTCGQVWPEDREFPEGP